MTVVLHPSAQARQPQQQRAIDRFESVLEAAQAILEREGLAGFSIPAVADATGFSRASIYKFFPTPFAILNELTRRHLQGLEKALADEAKQIRSMEWEDGVRAIVRCAAAFHNAHPTGMKLALGGAVTDESFRSYAVTVQDLGSLARALLAARGVEIPLVPVDAAALAVDLGTTCFRQSHSRHRRILPQYEAAAASVMIDFIRSQLK